MWRKSNNEQWLNFTFNWNIMEIIIYIDISTNIHPIAPNFMIIVLFLSFTSSRTPIKYICLIICVIFPQCRIIILDIFILRNSIIYYKCWVQIINFEIRSLKYILNHILINNHNLILSLLIQWSFFWTFLFFTMSQYRNVLLSRCLSLPISPKFSLILPVASIILRLRSSRRIVGQVLHDVFMFLADTLGVGKPRLFWFVYLFFGESLLLKISVHCSVFVFSIAIFVVAIFSIVYNRDPNFVFDRI